MSPDNMFLLENLFNILDIENNEFIMSNYLVEYIENSGIKINDTRLLDFVKKLKQLNGFKKNIQLDKKIFCDIIYKNACIIKKVLLNDLIVPDFQDFSKKLETIFYNVKPNKCGKNATYIKELAKVNPELFGVSVCTIDGQQLSIGDTDFGFCVQSCSKPISYLIAVQELGFEKVHHCMGCEPSGVEFNRAILKNVENTERMIPHNPMINAGAIMSCSMIQINKSQADKFNKIMEVWGKLAGNTRIGYQNSTFLSEKSDADRNMCLGFMMKEKGAFHKHIKSANDLFEVLDLYFQTCSIEYNCEQLSILAATLANGGICPTTNDKIFEAEHVKNCLSLMSSCGMYDYSGEWCFKVGIPAKSGVGGGIFLVIPGKMEIATFSPRLDKNGNSVRGIDFAIKLTQTFNFHQYDNNLPGINSKNNPTDKKNSKNLSLMNLLFAASKGDLTEIKLLRVQNFNLLSVDYDKRSALHLAASGGHINVLKYLINHCEKDSLNIHCKDRWDRTPLDDAKTGNFIKCIELLESIKN